MTGRHSPIGLLLLVSGCGSSCDGDLVVDDVRRRATQTEVIVDIDVRDSGQSAVWVHGAPHRALAELEDGRIVIALHPEPAGTFVADFTPLVEYHRLSAVGDILGLDGTTLTVALPAIATQLGKAGTHEIRYIDADEIVVEVGWYRDDPGTQGFDHAPEPDGVAIGEWLR